MEKITLDFEFIKNSRLHGDFLISCYDEDPDILITDISRYYEWRPGSCFLSVEVPEEVAVFLKLQNGKQLRVRPALPETEGIKKTFIPKPFEKQKPDLSDWLRKMEKIEKEIEEIEEKTENDWVDILSEWDKKEENDWIEKLSEWDKKEEKIGRCKPILKL